MKVRSMVMRASWLLLAVSTSCASSAESASPSSSADINGQGGADSVDGIDGVDGIGAGSDGADGPGPEVEAVAALPPPVAGDRQVFIPSETLDAIVRIDAATLAIDLIEVGIDPTAIAGYRTAAGFGVIATNTTSEDVSVVANAEGDTVPTAITLEAGTALNQLAVAPDGQSAIAWYSPGPDSDVDVGSLQEVRAIVLTPGKEAIYPVGVGFRPLSVSFGAEGDAAAYVVTERGVSRISLDDLDGATFAPPVAVSPDPLESADDREVLIAGGTTAVVRRGGVSEVRFIALATGKATIVTTDTPPTDIDLTPSGLEALAVLRDEGAVLRLPLADPSTTTRVDLGGLPVGQLTLTPDGRWAALFTSQVTNTAPNEWVVVLDLETGDARTVPLEKSVRAVAPSPDGKRLVVLHQPVQTGGSALAAVIDRSEGYSVIDVASGYAKLAILDSRPFGVVVTDDSRRGFVLVPAQGADTLNSVVDIDLLGLSAHTIPLGSPPVHAVPVGGRLAVDQAHPSGRVTFIDLASDRTETVTGFQLNGLIR